ncbi:MAG: polymer-forming cytoskeletal protein [Nitrospinae bacterium]|nr:polymer-forming cytoskeletal protein [Nitrospinota bacterium]MBI3815245.1 polymer-forming cytoskeletal protein [Nitrospinota bacterium]
MNQQEKKEEVKAFLGEGTEFKGLLSFEGTVRIDGKFEGEVVSKDTLIVGENAVMSAEVSVGTIVVRGKITGNIATTKKIEILSKGEIIGNIKTPLLFVEEGAILDGKCEMIKRDKKVTVLPTKESAGLEARAPAVAS